MPGRIRPTVDIRLLACSRCQSQQALRPVQASYAQYIRPSSSFAKSSTTPSFFPPPDQLPQRAYTHLSNRSIIRLQGPDVVDFLNGLLPAKLQPLPQSNCAPIFTAFLSAKGRILYEAFIYPPKESDSDGSWYIDTESETFSALFSHLKKHKLRSKFKLEKISGNNVGVYYAWPGQNTPDSESLQLGGQDPRALMGIRFLSDMSNPSPILAKLQEQGTALSLDDYKIHRMLCGHAEGSKELISTSALPQESNIDFDNGIDFHKGCYLGQELTIRTHHTGVVRKRILPCQIIPSDQTFATEQSVPVYDSSVIVHQPPGEANIAKMHAKGRAGRSTGKWLGGVGNIGLALCRLEVMTDIQLTAEGTIFDPEAEFNVVWEEGDADADGKTTLHEVKLKPFVPQWMRDIIQAGIQARADRSKRRRQEEDDDDDLD